MTELEPLLKAIEALQPHIERRGGYALPEVRGRLELRSVGFSYPTRPDHCVMEGFDLVAEPGETVAICGASGSGKSTAIQLLEQRSAARGIDRRTVTAIVVGDLEPLRLRRVGARGGATLAL